MVFGGSGLQEADPEPGLLGGGILFDPVLPIRVPARPGNIKTSVESGEGRGGICCCVVDPVGAFSAFELGVAVPQGAVPHQGEQVIHLDILAKIPGGEGVGGRVVAAKDGAVSGSSPAGKGDLIRFRKGKSRVTGPDFPELGAACAEIPDPAVRFRVAGVPPGKPENPLLMRVYSSKRASEQGFPGVGIIAPQQSVSLVKSLVKMQSAADGRFFLSIPEVICYTEIRPAKGVRR